MKVLTLRVSINLLALSTIKNNIERRCTMITCDTMYGVRTCDESHCDNCPLQKYDYYKEDADVPDEDL